MAKTMNLGKVAMTTAGDYDSSKSYERLTCVLYNHVSWVSRKEVPAGIVPGTNELYWQKVSERGEQGIQGLVGPQGNSAFDGNGVEIVNNLTQGGEAAVLSAEQGKILDTKLATLSADAKKVNDITLVIKSNNINTSSIEFGGYGADYENGTINAFASTSITRSNTPVMFEQGKSIYLILENAPMQFITIIPIDADGKPIGSANVLLYAKNKATLNTVFTPPQGAVGMLFYAQSEGITDYKLGLYYTDYETSVVEESEVVVDADKLVKDGKKVVYTEEANFNKLSAEVSGLSEDAAKINNVTLAIKSNNLNSAKIELGGYSANYENGTVAPFASSTTTRCDAPVMFEQGKSIYMILEDTPDNMSYITIIPIDINGKPVGTANVLLYARNKSTHDTEFTPPQGAAGMLFFCSQSQGVTNYKLGLYYTDYETSIVEEYKPDEVVVDANKLVKDGKKVVFTEKKEFDTYQERLNYDKAISKEVPTIDAPDVEYSKNLISAVRQEISEMWRWISQKEVTILDSGVCGESLTWKLYSDGLLHISGNGRAYDYCKGLLMDELVGDEYDSLPTMRAKIEQYQSHYIGLTDADSVAKYERGFQEGKIYDDEHEQYFAPWYIYRPEQDFTEYGGGYSSKANYDMHNPNGWQYNRIIIDEGVTYLGNWMLYRLCGVSELVLPSSVKGIGQWCIRYSPSLKCVYLNDGIETIEKQGCSRLETCEAIRMGDGYTRVEDSAFAQNSKVKSMYLSGNIDYVGVRPFAYNYEMTDITIKGVESIDVWFTECDNLRRVQLSEGLVTIKPSAFVSKRNLSAINIPSTVENIGKSAFYECPNLRVVYLDSPTIAANVVNYAGTESADFLITNVEYLYINSKITNISAWILENFTKVNDADGYALYLRNS